MAVVGQAAFTGKVTGSFELGKYVVRAYYRVIVNSRADGPITVASAPGLPALYSSYELGNESNDEMLLRRFECDRQGDVATMTWEVVAVYETPPTKEEKSTGNTGGGTGREKAGEFLNPLLEMPLVKWHSTNRESLITQIYDNTTGIFKPCTSSNGEVYDPPPKFIDGYDQLEITRNESISYPQPQTAILYKNAVNTDRFWGQAPGIWRCDKISPERQERQIPSGGRFPFLRTTYIFEANPAGWDLSLMDYGTFYLEEDPRNANPLALGSFPVQKRRFMTEDNHPTSGALNGRGGPLAQKIEVQIVDSASSVFTIAATTPSIKFQSGDLVQLSNTGGRLNSVKAIGGRTVQNPAPNYPMGLTQGGVYYVTNPGDTASGGQEFDLSPVKPTAANSSGQKLRVNDDGTGTHYISQPGVFFTIRPYKRLPFARLALPQGFAQVQ